MDARDRERRPTRRHVEQAPTHRPATAEHPVARMQRLIGNTQVMRVVAERGPEDEEEPVQRAPEDEEEPVQRAPEEEEEPVQRAPEEEEEPVQRAPEEEEMVQGKFTSDPGAEGGALSASSASA